MYARFLTSVQCHHLEHFSILDINKDKGFFLRDVIDIVKKKKKRLTILPFLGTMTTYLMARIAKSETLFSYADSLGTHNKFIQKKIYAQCISYECQHKAFLNTRYQEINK